MFSIRFFACFPWLRSAVTWQSINLHSGYVSKPRQSSSPYLFYDWFSDICSFSYYSVLHLLETPIILLRQFISKLWSFRSSSFLSVQHSEPYAVHITHCRHYQCFVHMHLCLHGYVFGPPNLTESAYHSWSFEVYSISNVQSSAVLFHVIGSSHWQTERGCSMPAEKGGTTSVGGFCEGEDVRRNMSRGNIWLPTNHPGYSPVPSRWGVNWTNSDMSIGEFVRPHRRTSVSAAACLRQLERLQNERPAGQRPPTKCQRTNGHSMPCSMLIKWKKNKPTSNS